MNKSKHQVEQLKEEESSVKIFCDYLKKNKRIELEYEPGENPPDYYLLKDNKKIIAIECRDIVSEKIDREKIEDKLIFLLEKELNDEFFIKNNKIENKRFLFFINFKDKFLNNKRENNYLIHNIKKWFTFVLKKGENLKFYLDKAITQDFIDQDIIEKIDIRQLRFKSLESKNISLIFQSGNNTRWIPDNYREEEIIYFIKKKNLALALSLKYEHVLLIHVKDFFIDTDHIKLALDNILIYEKVNVDKIYIISNSLSEERVQLIYEKEI